jgi:sortase A
MTGNTVINGHHNVSGKVFGKLVDIEIQDIIEVRSGGKSFYYEVKEIIILKERDATLEERIKNASWIERTEDERLTLVTCHPKNTNTHRLLVIAFPVLEEDDSRTGQ